jgi:hypothetical protein
VAKIAIRHDDPRPSLAASSHCARPKSLLRDTRRMHCLAAAPLTKMASAEAIVDEGGQLRRPATDRFGPF